MHEPAPQLDKAYPLAIRGRLWLGIAVAMQVLQLRWWWEPGKDAGAYISIARSIATDGRLDQLGHPSIWYAPGYPVVIAPAFWLGDRPFLAISIINILLALVGVAGVYQWFKRLGPAAAGVAALLTAMVMVNDSVLDYTRTTLSESVFFPALIWTAVALQRLLEERDPWKVWRWCALCAALTCYTVMVRSVGVFVLAGYGLAGLWLAWHGRMSRGRLIGTCAAIGVPVLAVIVAWSLREKAVAEQLGLKSHFGFLILNDFWVTVESIRLRLCEIGRMLVPGMHKAGAPRGRWLHPNTLVFLPLGLLVLALWLRTLRNQAPNVLMLTLPLYLLFFCFWPYDQSTRYVMPMLPVFVAAVWGALRPLPRHRYAIAVALTLAHLLGGLGGWAADVPKSWRANHSLADADAVAAVIGPPTTDIAATEPHRAPLALGFVMDRPIAFVDPAKEPVTARWLILAPNLDPPAGYVLRHTTPTMKLAERQ